MSQSPVTGSLLILLACCLAEEDGVCPAGGCGLPSASTDTKDWWPSSAGRVGQYGFVPYEQPWNLSSSLAWSRDFPVDSKVRRSHSVTLGTTIDSGFNVYVSSHDGIMKFNKDGEQLWKYLPENATLPTNPSLYQGRLYGSDHQGHVFAVDMDSGTEIFRTKVSEITCGDTASVTAHDGVVVAGVNASQSNYELCGVMVGLNASTGQLLWRYLPDDPVWNVMAQFPDDGTLVFQDKTGKAYRLKISDGSLLWKNGGWPDSWTDGTQILYEDVVYTVQTNGCDGPNCPGTVSAFRLADGQRLWSAEVPRPPNAFPVVGRLGPGKGLSVVMPIGQQPGCWPGVFRIPIWQSLPLIALRAIHQLSIFLGDYSRYLWLNDILPTDIYVLDAATGEFQWKWTGPTWHRVQCPGDEEDFVPRIDAGTRSACCPNTWGGPKLSADGTIYVGNQNGDFLAIRDANGDGKIDDATEVSRYNTGAAFSGPGSAHAPGMIAIASCDTVYVFKT